MAQYSWMFRNKQDSEYASGPKHACQNSEKGKVQNMAAFSICERYAAFWICQNMLCQSSEYILGSKCAKILNMARFWICKGAQYAWISLDMP